MEKITVNGELLIVLHNKNEWIKNIPNKLPKKRHKNETFLWVDINGNTFEMGIDFTAAEKNATYPCKVYRLQRVSEANN